MKNVVAQALLAQICVLPKDLTFYSSTKRRIVFRVREMSTTRLWKTHSAVEYVGHLNGRFCEKKWLQTNSLIWDSLQIF